MLVKAAGKRFCMAVPSWDILSTYLLTDNIVPGLDICRDGSRPSVICVVHHPNSAPYAVLIDSVLAELDKFDVVDINIRNVPLVRGHPRRDWPLVTV